MIIREITQDDTAALEQFFRLPYEVYRNDPVWVPESREAMRIFSESRTGIIRVPLLALEGQKTVARLVCTLHPLAQDEQGKRQGWIGHFEALDGYRAQSRELLKKAESVLGEWGSASLITPKTDNHSMGFLSKGFRLPQTVMTMHNPSYYPEIFLDSGYAVKSKSVSFYYRRSHFRPPKLTVGGIHTRELNPQNLAAEVRHFNNLQNRIFSGKNGYLPRSLSEDEQLLSSFLPFINQELVIFAENSKGQPIGLLLCLPDINQAKRGEIITRVRIVSVGVLPGWEGKGVGKAMGYHLMRNLLRKTEYTEAEASWIQNSNIPPQILALKFGARHGREFVLLQKFK